MKYISIGVIALVGLLSSCLPSGVNTDTVTQYQKDTTAISAYIKQNNIPATKLSYGVWFIIDSQTEGVRATFKDSMQVTYSLKLLPGNDVVDQVSSPTLRVLSDQIAGVQIAMPYFPKGSSGRIFIPSYYGYQNTQGGAIPANSNLTYDFTLNDVVDYHLKSDTVAIDNYLKENNITATVDPSGLRYKIDTIGTGTAIPSLEDSVWVKYSLTLLTGENVQSFTTQPIRYLLDNHTLAWKIALPLVPEGTYMTLYVPSSLGFGPNTVTGNASQNYSNLIYKVKLLKVVPH